LTAVCACAAAGLLAGAARAAEPQSLQTPSGARFALLGEKGAAPAPTLFVFATDQAGTLTNPQFNKVGSLLASRGFLCVSLDVPCHGADVRPGEKAGDLSGWRARLEKGEDLVAPFTRRVSEVLDYLVKEGFTDPARVAAAGTSRGGFIALHCAAAEPRIKAVVAFAPVSDLNALREFKGTTAKDAADVLHTARLAPRLAGRSVWLCIGNHDERVSTDDAIATTRAIVRAAAEKKLPLDVELFVTATPGHTIHKTAHDEAAAWLGARLTKPK
jgi:dienelactone hydrolase